MKKLDNGMFGYVLSPIDWFDGCIDLDDFIKNYQTRSVVDDDFQKHNEIHEILTRLLEGMKFSKWWEGDLREPIKVFAVPGDGKTDVGFIWKQDNNGTTFVLSPVPLQHLESLCDNFLNE